MLEVLERLNNISIWGECNVVIAVAVAYGTHYVFKPGAFINQATQSSNETQAKFLTNETY